MNIQKTLTSLIAGVALAGAVDSDALEIKIPSIGKVDTNDKIISGGHFTWGEATKNGTRIPVNSAIVSNIIQTAKYLEEVRDYFGDKPIVITSWYRDPKTNAKVGGAKESQHMSGRAVDFRVVGVPPLEVYKKLDSYWADKGGLGEYSGWTHIDDRGYSARWSAVKKLMKNK